jgi:RNA polymerase sigma factor (sigma-70 family)
MLFIPADAEDATQEILVKVITHLGTFNGESRFETWVYSIASNHLLTTRKCRAERWQMTFDKCVHAIEEGAPDNANDGLSEAERNLIEEETKLACVHYLLPCLKREVRLAVILGEIFGVKSAEGARILGLTPAAYRQRLSRGKNGQGFPRHEMRARRSEEPLPLQDAGGPPREEAADRSSSKLWTPTAATASIKRAISSASTGRATSSPNGPPSESASMPCRPRRVSFSQQANSSWPASIRTRCASSKRAVLMWA